MKEFLKEYLREEDIPQKVDGQLDALLSDADIVGDAGGNQAGKSVAGCIKGYIKSTGELPLSLRQHEKHFENDIRRAKNKLVKGRVVGVSSKQMKNTVIPTWHEWCPKQYLKKGSWSESYSAGDDTLTLYRGKKKCANIEFMSNQQDVETFQGPPLDFLIYDEEPREDIHKENRMRFVTSEKKDITFCWTPTKGLSWATDLFSDNIFEGKQEKGKIELFKLCTVSNPKANLDVVREILNEITNYNELKMRLLGEFISLSGLVYGNLFNRTIHVIEPFDITYNEYIVYRGLDPHEVKPTVGIEIAMDREGFEYVCGTYIRAADTEIIKADLAERAKERHYRLGWTRCDKSADSTIKALGDRNIFRELGRGANAIPALQVSEKYTGSVHAGVDIIKQLLKDNRLFIFNIPENQILIKAMQTLERETYANEDKKGLKDRIAEGKHDTHAALRYPHQRIMNWRPPIEVIPTYAPIDEVLAY
jgi:phage terminase large subunit-like protein